MQMWSLSSAPVPTTAALLRTAHTPALPPAISTHWAFHHLFTRPCIPRHEAPTMCSSLCGQEGARVGARASSRCTCKAWHQHNVNGRDAGSKGMRGSVLKPGSGPWLLACQLDARSTSTGRVWPLQDHESKHTMHQRPMPPTTHPTPPTHLPHPKATPPNTPSLHPKHGVNTM